MKPRVALTSLLVILLIFDAVVARKSGGGSRGGSRGGSKGGSRGGSGSSGGSSGGWSSSSSHSGSSNNHGSQPGTIGWNVPNAPKPSAPEPTLWKAPATHTQSENPYSRQPSSNPFYPSGGNQPSSGGNHPPSGGYHPPSGGYHPPSGGYHPPPPAFSYPQSHGSTNNQPPSYPHQQYPGSYGGNPSSGYGGYPSSGYGGYPSSGHGGYPSSGHGGYPSSDHGGYPSSGHGGHAPLGQTVIVQSGGSSGPGIGQIAKEAVVHSVIDTAVKATANRIIPGGIHGHSGEHGGGQDSSSGAAPVSHTHITYNNYYNNGTAPAAPSVAQTPVASTSAPAANSGPSGSTATSTSAGAQGSSTQSPQQDPVQNYPSPSGFIITDVDIQKLSEDLYKKDTNNAFKYITINLQGQKNDTSDTNDVAPEHLLTVKPEAYEIPTVKAVLALHDNYKLDMRTREDNNTLDEFRQIQENISSQSSSERKEESNLLDEFLKSEVLLEAMRFLAGKGYLPNDLDEFKDALNRIWFSQYSRIGGEPASSGFENVFLAEQYVFVAPPNDTMTSSNFTRIDGLHNWIYFAKQEEANQINYLGHFKEQKLGSNGAVVKLQSSLNGTVQPVTTILVGTSPELEMALYTICFYTRPYPNAACPVSLGGSKFWMDTFSLNYFGRLMVNYVFLDTGND